VTAENAMKTGPIHPRENEYCWRDADSIVAFAKRNRLRVRGHNLCWHNQAPKWMFVDGEGKRVNRDVLLKRLKEHITAVVKRSNKSRRSYTQCISGCSASTGKRSAA